MRIICLVKFDGQNAVSSLLYPGGYLVHFGELKINKFIVSDQKL